MTVAKLIVAVLLIAVKYFALSSNSECMPRSYGLDSIVCVCNATYCDAICREKPLPSSEYVLYTSNQADVADTKTIVIDSSTTYQTIIGWGGAFTDAAGQNIYSLNDGAKRNLLRSYFSSQGIEYNLGRVPMGSSDFSTHPYSYDDGDEDIELKNFKLAPEDYKYKIPLLKQASKLSTDNLWLLASAWTSPTWMKTNDRYAGSGFLRPPMYQAWANYFLKFLKYYHGEGVNFWGITTGNQPSLVLIPNNRINTVGWLPHQMRYWIGNNLGPALRNSNFSSIKILVFDDQKMFLPRYVDQIFLSKQTKNYTDGIAVHSYPDESFPSTSLSLVHKHFPDQFILSTEASDVLAASVSLGSWKNAGNYANDIIMNLNNWVTGWMDSNVALDMTGGPTYVRSRDSPIIVNAAADEFYKQPMFYALGHFSKFIPRGSIRINVSKHDQLKIVGFKRPDDGIVIVILNRKSRYIPLIVNDKRRGYIEISVDDKSVNTILYW